MDDEIGASELVRRRLWRSGLAGGFGSAEECCSALLGIQAQVPRYSSVSLFNRVPGLTSDALDRSFSDRSVVAQWGQRRTLHLYSVEDSGLVCRLFHDRNYLDGPGGASPEALGRLRSCVSGRMGGRGSIGREELLSVVRGSVPDVVGLLPYGDYASLCWLTNNGVLVGVPGRSAVSEFVPAPPSESAGDPMEEAMRRYFRSYGPATLRDFCHWSGIPLRDARPAFGRIADDLDPVACGGAVLHSLGPGSSAGPRAVTVLGMYDPLAVAYADKGWAGGPEVQRRIWRSAGRVCALVLIGGRVCATWSIVSEGGRARFAVDPVRPISEQNMRRISSRLSSIAGFLGMRYGGIEMSVR